MTNIVGHIAALMPCVVDEGGSRRTQDCAGLGPNNLNLRSVSTQYGKTNLAQHAKTNKFRSVCSVSSMVSARDFPLLVPHGFETHHDQGEVALLPPCSAVL
jgi:hypothetical protein